MALRLFSRENWSSSDIDVYTQYIDSISIVGAYLESEGYQFQPFFWQTENLEESIERADRVKRILWERHDDSRPFGDGSHTDFYGIEQIKDVSNNISNRPRQSFCGTKRINIAYNSL